MPKKKNNHKQTERSSRGNEANPKKPDDRRAVEVLSDAKREQKSVVPVTETILEDRKYSKRKVVSNWDRYVDPSDLPPEDDSVDPYNENTDYSYLSCSKATGGQEFRLKSEKDWEDENLGRDLQSEAMRLDLKEITLALNTIPLYRRFQLDPNYFSAADIASMEEEAEKNKSYFQVCQESVYNSESKVSEPITDILLNEETMETKKIVDKVIENHLVQQPSVPAHVPTQKQEERGGPQKGKSEGDFLDYLLNLEDTKEEDQPCSDFSTIDDIPVDEWVDSIIND